MKRCRQCGAPAETRVDGLCPSCQHLKDHPDALAGMTIIGSYTFKDLKQMNEDERIQGIAAHLKANPGKTIGVLVDTGPGHQDKGDRYIRGVRALLPGVRVLARRPGPVANVESISFQYYKQN